MSKATLTKFGIWRAVTFVIATVAFVIAQLSISAHAAKYGDGPHEHGGQVCVLSLAAPATDKFIDNASILVVGSLFVWSISNLVAQTERAHILVRASRPRGPPNHNF